MPFVALTARLNRYIFVILKLDAPQRERRRVSNARHVIVCTDKLMLLVGFPGKHVPRSFSVKKIKRIVQEI